jgi:hypothetical protein
MILRVQIAFKQGAKAHKIDNHVIQIMPATYSPEVALEHIKIL